jgi:hypothetical protein
VDALGWDGNFTALNDQLRNRLPGTTKGGNPNCRGEAARATHAMWPLSDEQGDLAPVASKKNPAVEPLPDTSKLQEDVEDN